MGTDSGTFSRGTHSGEPRGPQAGSDEGGLGGGAPDFEHRGPMAPAAAV